AEYVKKLIISLSFNGRFFEDNATRVNGKLEKTGNISETCQYYAFYCDIADENNFPELYKTMFTVFGKNRDDTTVYPEVYKSNAFIGDMLRLDYLAEHGKAEQAISECKDYYYGMVKRTGTLWEHETPIGSLVHCFSAMIAVWIKNYYAD
ncbi:MAG: hypothetical protein J6Y43_08060, partial [Clostridia bacterium]|nr:hypothetical protein [Clostridia bacterium]